MDDSRAYLLDILKELIDQDVQFVVCGGVAAVLHGVQRLTLDLDLSLMMSRENLERFLAVMNKEKMVPRAPVPSESILDPAILDAIVKSKGALVFTFVDPENAVKQVDFFLTPDKSYEAISVDTVEVAIEEGYVLQVASVDKLIKMKEAVIPPRAKDLLDISELRRLKDKRS